MELKISFDACDFMNELPILIRRKNLIYMFSMRRLLLVLLLLVSLIPLNSCHWFLGSYDGPTIVSHGYVEGVTPSNIEQFNTRDYPTVQANWEGPGGDKIWLAVNLGATEKPFTSADPSPQHAGWYFQFNRKQGFYHNGSTLIPQWTTRSINEDTAWEPANDPCRLLLGNPWRLPKIEELRAFRSAPLSQGGMGEGNRTDAFNSVLNLHAPGYLHSYVGELRERGESASYWASDQFSPTHGEALGIGEGSGTFGGGKAFGRLVRCVKE